MPPFPNMWRVGLDYCHKGDFDWLNFIFPTTWWGLKRNLSKLPQGRQGLNRLMIATQVYNPLAFACYQMGRPQSMPIRIYLDILKRTYFRQFFLRACIFLHTKFLKTRNLHYSSKWSSGYTITSCMQKVFIAAYICLCNNSHIILCFLWPEKDPIWFWGTKENIRLAAWTMHRFSTILCYTMMLPMTWRGLFW